METKKRELKLMDYVIIIGIPLVLIIMVLQFVLDNKSENLVYVIFVIFGYSCLLKGIYKKKEMEKKDGIKN